LYQLGKSPEEIERKKLDEAARKLLAAEADALEKVRVSAAEKLRKKNLTPQQRKAEAEEARAAKKISSDLKKLEKENKLNAARLRLVGVAELPIIAGGNIINNNAADADDNNESVDEETSDED